MLDAGCWMLDAGCWMLDKTKASILFRRCQGWVGGNPKFEIRNSKFSGASGRIEYRLSSIG
jgi:hypothetical protein